MYHVKRDGGFLCGAPMRRNYLAAWQQPSYVHFSEAVKFDKYKDCCDGCLKRLMDIVSHMNPPIVIK